MTQPSVCVLILNRDRRDDTLACLASLRQSCLAHKLRNVMVKVPQETAVSSGTRPGR